MQLAERIEMVRSYALQVLEKAGKHYGLNTHHVDIRFDLRGRAAGMAGCRIKGDGSTSDHYIRFNVDMIKNSGFEHVFKNTVPHEVAHVVCYMNPALGRGHNQGWRRVCQGLGGNGDTCHKQEVVFAKGHTYTYITTLGHKINLSQQRHRKIQRGSVYSLRGGLGILNKTCKWSRYVTVADNNPASAVMVTEPTAPANTATTVDKTVKKSVSTGKGTKADKVRVMIRHAKINGADQQVVIAQVVAELDMTKALAKSYVKNNWDRV